MGNEFRSAMKPTAGYRHCKLAHQQALRKLQRIDLLVGLVRALDEEHARALSSLPPAEIRPWELRGQALELVERALVRRRPVVERTVQELARDAAMGADRITERSRR